MTPDRAAFSYVGAFVEELARSGLTHVCIAPGSRSTPLALMLAQHPSIRTWVHLDERVAGFFALGMARALRAPVGLLCTSGTAGAHFYPAIIEARRSGIPLLVMTADRPHELRDVGAAQTIDQNRLYSDHAKWFVDVALPEASVEMLRYSRTLACRAVSMAAATPAGPVHLNFPFREPLVPSAIERPKGLSDAEAEAWDGRPDGQPWVSVADALPTADMATVEWLSSALLSATRPLIVCGPQFDAELAKPLAELARAVGAPLLADPLSQLRWGNHDRSTLIDRYDAALRHEPLVTELAPDLVLRIGGLPTSKTLLQYLERHANAAQVVIDAARWPDPMLVATDMVHADPRLLCEMLLEAIEIDEMRRVESTGSGGSSEREQHAEWLGRWRTVDATAGRALSEFGPALEEPFEGRALAEIAALVPGGGTLFVSSSMPVRDLDAFAAGDERELRVLANRGANGIDGVVSTALGVAAAGGRSEGPLVLVIGDIAFYHDMNGLLAAKLHDLDATIVVINNDGGGIFSFLPQATQTEHFEQLFGTPHGLDFAPAAALYEAEYELVETWQAFRDALTVGIAGGGLHIIELRTDRERNVILHREAWAAVSAALSQSDR